MVSGARRIVVWGLGLLALAGCAAMIEEARRGATTPAPLAGPVSLAPFLSITGARLAPGFDGGGFPRGAIGGAFTRLVRPVAVAARDQAIFIADAGVGAIYRYEPGVETLARLPAVAFAGGTQLEVATDRTLLVLDAGGRRMLRFAPTGQPMQTIGADLLDLGRPIDMVADAASGILFVADGAYAQVLAVRPAGGAAQVLPVRATDGPGPGTLVGIAAGPTSLYLLDAGCRCVLVTSRDGRIVARFGAGDLQQPVALVADAAGRVYVADNGSRELLVYTQHRITQRFAYRSIGVTEVSDLALGDGALFVADATGGRVEARRIVSLRP